MLTPQEVSGHAFAKASFGGYNMAMVDEFLDTLTVDYTALYKENQTLKSKMKVLVDKVEEYRATEESMRKAFLVAQRSAEDIVARAEEERTELVRQAEGEIRARVEGARQELEGEQHRLAAAAAATADYVAKVRALCQNELNYLDSLPLLGVTQQAAPVAQPRAEQQPESPPAQPQDPGEAMPPPAEEDGGLYADLMEGRRGRPLPEEEEEDAPDEPDEPTRRFDNLQFGKDYEIR